MSALTKRYVGLDVHKHYVMVAAVNAAHEVVLRPQRVNLTTLPAWARKHLHPSDEVALEATSNAWYVHDLLAPLVATPCDRIRGSVGEHGTLFVQDDDGAHPLFGDEEIRRGRIALVPDNRKRLTETQGGCAPGRGDEGAPAFDGEVYRGSNRRGNAKCIDGGFGKITQSELPDWNKIKYIKEKPKEHKLTKQEQEEQAKTCKEYDDKIKDLKDRMAKTTVKSEKLQMQVDKEYYEGLAKDKCSKAQK